MSELGRRLEAARRARNLDIGQLAHELGISFESYQDLEWFENDVLDGLSFVQLLKLGSLLELDLRSLFEAGDVEPLTFVELAERLESYRVEHRLTAPEFEDQLGWAIGNTAPDPKALAELPASALEEVAAAVEVDWRALLPPR
jgi:hypothetical protein